MRSSKRFHWILIVFLLLAYQSKTLHFAHFLEKDDKCHLCVNTQNIDKTLLPLSYILIDAPSFVANNRQKVPLKRLLSTKIKCKILSKSVDFSDLHLFSVAPIPLGYFSHAPPKPYA